MSPAIEDVLAAKRLLNDSAEDHDKVRGLPGANLCIHKLTGNGLTILAFIAQSRDPDVGRMVAEDWERHPYRHHEWTFDGIPRRDPREQDLYCMCGNVKGHGVHTPCWKDE